MIETIFSRYESDGHELDLYEPCVLKRDKFELDKAAHFYLNS